MSSTKFHLLKNLALQVHKFIMILILSFLVEILN
jgi:hypothetical protein